MVGKKDTKDPNVEALTEYQDGRTLEDPEVGPADNIIVSEHSQQQVEEAAPEADE